jgi:hypothetical protein
LYTAIGLLVATSILVGVVALLQWAYTWLPVASGFAGSCALLYGSLLLVREARLAVRSTLQEVSLARRAVINRGDQGIEAETALDKTARKNDSLFYVTYVAESMPSYLGKDREKEMKINLSTEKGERLEIWMEKSCKE